MRKIDCEAEKLSSRAIGFLILPLTLPLLALGFMLVPVVGLFFAIPLLILSIGFLAAPESKACRLILRQDS